MRQITRNRAAMFAVFVLTCVMTLFVQAARANDFDYFGGLTYDEDITTPAEALGYEIGERFTRHSDMLSYLRTVAEQSDRVQIRNYGVSHQQRELVYLTISSPQNLKNLETILDRNAALVDPSTDDETVEEILNDNPTIAWFSYNVHGNEPSTSETALALTYTLAAATNKEIVDLLDNTVVVVDPCLNPDGRERYVNWYQNARGVAPIANPDAAEHYEPWPGGRSNHYLFDLNRDWVWLIHPESRSRIEPYRRYRPHLHVDFHEQGYRSPFFFGAGDDPYNMNIPASTRKWVERYGDANAVAFDREGLVYATRERFDYLYPGYGKVLPVYHGAVGMLAEKGGHSRAGLAIELSEEYTLTLRERTYQHWLLSMSNLEYSGQQRRGQLKRFREFFVDSATGEHTDAAAYIVAADNDPALLEKLWELCNAHGIIIETLDEAQSIGQLQQYDDSAARVEKSLPAGTWIIRTNQPMGRLVNVLFERDPEVTDPDTYDITSWSAPIAFGLEAWISPDPAPGDVSRLEDYAAPNGEVTGEGDVALLIDGEQYNAPRAVAIAAKHELFARMTSERITIDGVSLSPGSIIVHRIRNEEQTIEAFVEEITAAGLNVHRVATGMTQSGPVLGANANRRLALPKVLLLRDESCSSLSVGQHWHLFDIASPLPYTPVNASTLRRLDLDQYNTLVLPSGFGLRRAFGDDLTERLRDWVRDGGVIVASGGASSFANASILNLSADEEAEDDSDRDEGHDQDRPPLRELTYEQRRDRSVEDRIPGSQMGVDVDVSHPLAAGVPDWVGVIKRGGRTLPVSENGYVVARFSDSPRIGGVISERNEQKIAGQPFMTHHRLGGGAVICFSDDLTIRGFQHGPMRLLLNAVMYGPSM